jgi:meso-butanediol dehydrogenase / (S,S)-butanediol dehydrogenase / diacetyl reductase
MSLRGKSVVITGATSGLGAACVFEFIRCGARVAMIGRDQAKADVIAKEVRGRGGTQLVVLGDVSDAAFCERSIGRVVEDFGAVDVLVNSAGIIPRGDALEITDEDWNNALRVNVSGTFWMCRAAICAMKKSGGGAIVNVSSDWGLVAGAGHVAYCATKGAVVNMTRALALDHIADGIRINVVCPGEIRTPMLQKGLEKRGFDPATGMEEIGRTIPIGRVSEPEEQARCIRFLASDEASFVVGAAFSVDGGSTAS